MCSSSRFAFVNTETGETVRGNCNAWSCPECGRKKRAMVARAIREEVKDWKRIRFWRFSINHNISDIETHRKILAKSWNIFCKEMRRSKLVGFSQKNFQYVRIMETCEDGYYHQHCLIDEFLHHSIVATLWANSVRAICKRMKIDVTMHSDRWLCTAWVNSKQHFTPELASNYVTKYITKSFEQALKNPKQKRYTKSRAIVFFRRKVRNEMWMIVKMYDADFDCNLPLEPFPAPVVLDGCTITHEKAPPNTPNNAFLTAEEVMKQVNVSEDIHYAQLKEQFSLNLTPESHYNHLCD